MTVIKSLIDVIAIVAVVAAFRCVRTSATETKAAELVALSRNLSVPERVPSSTAGPIASHSPLARPVERINAQFHDRLAALGGSGKLQDTNGLGPSAHAIAQRLHPPMLRTTV